MGILYIITCGISQSPHVWNVLQTYEFCTLKLYCERLKVKNNVLQVLGTAVFWSFPFFITTTMVGVT
jgi:hypothetical protein